MFMRQQQDSEACFTASVVRCQSAFVLFRLQTENRLVVPVLLLLFTETLLFIIILFVIILLRA